MATESSPARASSPILVAVNATRRCADILETAAALATSIGADLEVLLVEDTNLFRLADLPVTREVDRVSGMTRELSTARLRQALECETRRVRHELTRIRRKSSIHSTMRVVRGQILDEALAASSSVEVTFVHDARHTLPGESMAGLRTRRESGRARPVSEQRSRTRKPVWTVFEGGAVSMRALRVAARLARVLDCGLMVLVPCRDADEAASLEREARTAVDGIDLRFVQVAAHRSLLQERILTPGSSSLVVLARQSRQLQDEAMLSYLESICVPLVLVG